jgi:hypothetical protein
MDDERSGFVRFAFGVDWEDPARYDLVLNVDKLSVPVAVSTVLRVVCSPAISDAAAEALRTLGMMALASRAEAALSEATSSEGTRLGKFDKSSAGAGRLDGVSGRRGAGRKVAPG